MKHQKPTGRKYTATDHAASSILLAHSYGYQIRATFRILERVLQPMVRDKNLQLGHFYILRVLWEKDGLTQREISDAASITESTTMLTIKKMIEMNLIERRRNTGDQRKVLVHLTDKGRSLKDKLMPVATQINEIASAGIPKQDLNNLLRTMWQIQQNLHAIQDPKSRQD